MKTVLELSGKEALNYFLQSSNYCTIPLPKYFNFDKILDFVRTTVGGKDFANCYKKSLPSKFDNVSYKLFINKDARYTYRPMQLVNPYLYYFLSREITEETNWTFLINRFNEFKNDNCEVYSIPLVKNKGDKSVTATNITSWWNNIEQQSIKLSLKYKYILILDINNYYPSIYTHSISWALYGKEAAKENRNEKNLGNNIDKYIMGMQYGQTNGIPQGNVLSDFIAEIVLGYADFLLNKKLMNNGVGDYKILRYRDDFRFFCNNKEALETISLALQSVLTSLNLQINGTKTKLSESVIEISIKEDKLYYIVNTPIFRGEGKSIFNTLQQDLLFILQFSKKYPNSGTVSKLLNMFIESISKIDDVREDLKVLCALAVEIAFGNPRTYNLVFSIISNFVSKLKNEDDRRNLIEDIYRKLSRLPNIGYLEIWMQRISYEMEGFNKKYTEPLCKIINQEEGVNIWNNDWLRDELTEDFPINSICTDWIKKGYTPVIGLDEVSIFGY